MAEASDFIRKFQNGTEAEMEKKLTAILLDWSGTCIDYGCRAMAQTIIDVFKKKGFLINYNDFRLSYHKPLGQIIQDIFKHDATREHWRKRFGRFPGEKDQTDLELLFEDIQLKKISEYSKLIPGIPELSKVLKNLGIKIGINAQCSQRTLEKTLPFSIKQGFFPDSMVSLNDVPSGHPMPWMAYVNAIKLNTYPLSNMILIGDRKEDIEAGRNAGMWTIGLTQCGLEAGKTEWEISRMNKNELELLNNNIAKKIIDTGAHYAVPGPWEILPIIQEIDERIRSGDNP